MWVFLSGGVDSALLARFGLEAGARVTGRCLRLSGSMLDESRAAAASAAALGIPLEMVDLDEAGVAARALEFLSATDQPTIDGLNAFLVFSGAAFDERVVFTGTGLDELYFGYRWTVDMLREAGEGAAPSVEALAADWERRTGHLPADEVVALTGLAEMPRVPTQADPGPGHSLHHRLRSIALARFTADRLLRDLDEVAMYHSKEARAPFLGAPMLAHAQGLGAAGLFPRGLGGDEASYASSPLKQIVVDEAARRLPAALLRGRRKQGFTLPLDRIMAGGLAEHVVWALSPRTSPAAGLIDLERLRGPAWTGGLGGDVFGRWMVLVLAFWLAGLSRTDGLGRRLTPRSTATHSLVQSVSCGDGYEASLRS